MEPTEDTIKLYYNTEREKLRMPEYGRNVFEMVDHLRTIEDREKRTEQAKAVVKVMEILNPHVHSQENYEQKLWDHLYLIAGFDLDIDSPYPAPVFDSLSTRPEVIPLKKKPVKAYHYGRNIESIINLIAEELEGEVKTAMIRSLAIYMRQQYLIWNKDTVADATIFNDIEKLSDYRIKVPEGLSLHKIDGSASYARPGMTINVGGAQQGQQMKGWTNKKKKNYKKR